MTLDNMTGITKGSYTGFCKSQLITCNFVKACNGVCPFEDALKHADKTQTMNDQHTVDHDRDWIIGCIEHVLTTIQVSGRQPHARSGFYHDGFFHNDNGDTWKATDREVRAWMHLPDPYREDGEV